MKRRSCRHPGYAVALRGPGQLLLSGAAPDCMEAERIRLLPSALQGHCRLEPARARHSHGLGEGKLLSGVEAGRLMRARHLREIGSRGFGLTAHSQAKCPSIRGYVLASLYSPLVQTPALGGPPFCRKRRNEREMNLDRISLSDRRLAGPSVTAAGPSVKG